MNKKHLLPLLTTVAAGLVLASCQIAPVNATTTITSRKGAGSKTFRSLVLVDGSSQINPSPVEGIANENYYQVDLSDLNNITFTPKADGAKVKMVLDGILTNPNGLATTQAVWDEFNEVVKSKVPAGFNFSYTEVKSANWDDAYMTTVPGADVNAFKGYVYELSYSWESVDDYIAKTKTLIGDIYEETELAEYETDTNKKWATLTQVEGDTFKWEEAYLVNFWSVYGVADKVTTSEYFNLAAFGAGFEFTTDQTFACVAQEYKIGDGEVVKVNVDNLNGKDANQNLKFISATGTLPSETNTGLIVGLVVGGVAVVGAGVGIGVALKKKKAAK